MYYIIYYILNIVDILNLFIYTNLSTMQHNDILYIVHETSNLIGIIFMDDVCIFILYHTIQPVTLNMYRERLIDM